MPKMYLAKMKKKVPMFGTPSELMPKVSKGEYDRTMSSYREMINAPGLFIKNAVRCAWEIPTTTCDERDKPLYALMPINLLLWLYDLGSNYEESLRMFEGFAMVISKEQKHLGSKTTIPLQSMPLSRAAKDIIKNWRSRLSQKKNRQYTALQAMITALVCTARGRRRDPEDIVGEAMDLAVPNLSMAMPPIISTVTNKPHRFYVNAYTELDDCWNTMLFQVIPASAAPLILTALIYRASYALRKRGTGSDNLPRTDFIVRLCAYLTLSGRTRPEETALYTALAGRDSFW